MSTQRLAAAGTLVLALVPAAMALANRSSPLFTSIAAVLFLAAALREDPRTAAVTLLSPLRTPLGLATLAFLGWSLVSLAWSPFPQSSLRAVSEFAPVLLGAYLLARLAPGRLPAFAVPLGAACLAAACLFVLASLLTDLAPQRLLGQRVALFVLNRPVLTILLVAGPMALLLARISRIAAAALLALCAAAILRSISGAAAMGLIAGAIMAFAAFVLPRRLGVILTGLGALLAVALAPVEGDILHGLMPEAAHERLVQSSSRARVTIAQSFGAAVAQAPWIGSGYGISVRFPEVPAAQALEPEMRHMLGVGHPHNSFLQVWAELGTVGAFLASLVIVLALGALMRLPKPAFVTALGLAAAAVAVMFVEHGAWQAWWTAGLGTAITWMRAVSFGRAAPERETRVRAHER
ncbi:hypothetical protein LKMONMHP_0604 [Methylobacterium organophilum]|uniref:O-antigen ligase-related domain-containing protein n=2 Tax=Methylobacterium organophilum TaxID=410 RepID=A0ABQ4T679_METOR|nr:hypothetical protein LKMONMHP_0604 [Methylobacterium organophilum]